MSWATQRKLIITAIIFIIVAIPSIFLIKSFFIRPPTCFDRIKNQDEQGVDCGGSCALLCSEQAKDIVLLWDPRIFKVADGIYTALVYAENPNINAGSKDVPYTFRIYDESQPDVLIAERRGTINVYPQKSFPIIETGISTGYRKAGRATVTFGTPYPNGTIAKNIVWEKMEPRQEKIKISSYRLSDEETTPRIDASVENVTPEIVVNANVIVVIFDELGNAIGASQTYIPKIAPRESRTVTFTWPIPFSKKAAKVELFPSF